MKRSEQTALAERPTTALVEQRTAVKPPISEPEPEAHANGQAEHEEVIPKDLPKPSNLVVAVVAGVFCLLLLAIFLIGWFPSRNSANQAAGDAKEQSTGKPVVQVMNPRPQTAGRDIVLPCDVKANQATALFARANGYLKKFNFDIGDHVEAGKVLAEIETPETDAQLAEAVAAMAQSNSSVAKAQADLELAKATLDRYTAAQKQAPGSVNQEDIDTRRSAYDDAVAGLAVAKANVGQAQAVVDRLKVLQSYEKVIAPFSGTITARNYDVGALINPADQGSGKELFDLAATDVLRVFVNVPQADATNIHVGQTAFLSVRNYPGHEFQGVVSRTTGAIDANTRTLSIQLDFKNEKGELYPGMYGQARLRVTEPKPVLIIPTSGLIFNAQGLQAAIVRDDKIRYARLTVGRDYGTEIEITSGLDANDQVVTNPGEKLSDGVEVEVKKSEATPATRPG